MIFTPRHVLLKRQKHGERDVQDK